MFIEIFLKNMIPKYQYIIIFINMISSLKNMIRIRYTTSYDINYTPSLYNHSYVTQKLSPPLPVLSFNHSIRYHISHYLYHHYHHVVDVIDMANFSNFLEIHAKLKHYRYSQYHQMVFQNLM